MTPAITVSNPIPCLGRSRSLSAISIAAASVFWLIPPSHATTFEPVLVKGEVVGGATITDVGNGSMNTHGDVALRAVVDSGAGPATTFYHWSRGVLTVIATNDVTMVDTNVVKSLIGIPIIDDTGAVTFIDYDGATRSGRMLRWVGDGITVIAGPDVSCPAPLDAGGSAITQPPQVTSDGWAFTSACQWVKIAPNGTMSFIANDVTLSHPIDGERTNARADAAWGGPGGSAIILDGSGYWHVAPNGGSTFILDRNLEDPAFGDNWVWVGPSVASSAGHWLWQGQLRDGTSIGAEVVFTWRGGDRSLLFFEGDPYDDDLAFGSYGPASESATDLQTGPSITQSGSAVFAGSLVTDPPEANPRRGLFIADRTPPTPVGVYGAPTEGLGYLVNINRFEAAAVDSSERVVFSGRLNTGPRAVYQRREGGEVEDVLARNDVIEIGGNDVTIQEASVIRNPIVNQSTPTPFGGKVMSDDSRVLLQVDFLTDPDDPRSSTRALIVAHLDATPPEKVVTLRGLEISQVIQSWDNAITLYEGKRTTVRAHLEAPEPVRFRGRLRVTRGTSSAVLSPTNPLGDAPARTDADGEDRWLIDRSLNFELPSEWLSGAVTASLESDDPNIELRCDEADSVADCRTSVTFARSDTLRVRLVQTRLRGWADSTIPTPAQLRDEVDRLLARYPVDKVDYIPQYLLNYPATIDELELMMGVLRYEYGHERLWYAPLGIQPGPADCDWLRRDQLGNIISPSCPAGHSDRVLGVAWGVRANDYGSGRAAHELAHVLGLGHTNTPSIGGSVGACGAIFVPNFFTAASGTWKVPGCTQRFCDVATIGPLEQDPDRDVYGTRHEAGFTFGVNPRSSFDLMSYCGSMSGPFAYMTGRWTAVEVYGRLAASIRNRPAPHGLLPDRGRLLVSGRAAPAEPTIFLPAIPSARAASQDVAAGEALLRQVDAGGATLSQVGFEYSEPTDDLTAVLGIETAPARSFVVVIEPHPDLAAIEVIEDGQVVGRLDAGQGAPTVTITSPVVGDSFADEDVTIAWSASDPDGDPLSYRVEYSADDGSTWETLALGGDQTTLVVPARALAGSATARVRVTALDGLNYGEDLLAGSFTVANRAPELWIREPAGGRVYSVAQSMILDAAAVDVEDGVALEDSITWSSDRAGQLANGPRGVVDAAGLGPGSHVLTATAMDASGAMATASVTIEVVGELPADAMDTSIVAEGGTAVIQPGQTWSVAAVIANSGPGDVTGVSASVSVPSELSLSEAYLDDRACEMSESGTITRCTLDRLSVEASAMVTLSGRAAAAGIHRVTVDLAHAGRELNPRDNRMELEIIVSEVDPTVEVPEPDIGPGEDTGLAEDAEMIGAEMTEGAVETDAEEEGGGCGCASGESRGIAPDLLLVLASLAWLARRRSQAG